MLLFFVLTPIFYYVSEKVFADAPVSSVWDFSVASDYTISDSSKIEISGSSIYLKVQEYSSDANTGAIYHLNEDSGNVVYDSSTYAVNGSAQNVTWTSFGEMNGAAFFNGTRSYIAFPDSSSTSLVQNLTLEAWIKPSSAFKADSGSSDYGRPMGIMDKGAYQLYLDNATGQLVFELASNTGDSWTQVAGPVTLPAVTGASVKNSWDQNGQSTVTTMVGSGNTVFIGLGSAQSDAEVWEWDGSIWTKIGGDGIDGSWADATYEDVDSLAFDGTNLYVGLGVTGGDAEVWKWNGSTWAKIGGDGTGASPSSLGWAAGYEQVYALVYSGSYLYAGLGNSANDAEVWKWDPSTGLWLKVGGDSINAGWTTNFEMVYSLATNGNYIYAGLGNTLGDAEVWRYDPTGNTWLKLGGDGTGWGASGSSPYEMVQTLAASGPVVYAGLGNSTGDAEVYKYTYATSSWTMIGGDGTGVSPSGSGWADTTYERVWSLYPSGSGLYAGLGDGNADGEVWSWDGTQWAKLGGDGANTSWNNNTYQQVKALYYDGSKLFTGLTQVIGTANGVGEVWTYSGGTWAKIGGNGVNKSWGFSGLNSVETLVASGSDFYAGTGYTSQPGVGIGNALVWKYDNNLWSLIGGQGVNSSWAVDTYEQITSLGSYKSNLYAGLGLSTGDAEIWKWNGSAWSKIGGDGTGWGSAGTSIYEGVYSMVTDGNYLYTGLGGFGTSAPGDAVVYKYDGNNWSRIGGEGNGVSPSGSGWNKTIYERVTSLAIFRGNLLAGLGDTNGDAEVWSWNGSQWTKIGGDTVGAGLTSPALGWDNTNYNQVDTMAVYKNDLYVGLGQDAGEAEVWRYNGSTWTKVGGDGTGVSPSNTGWSDATYEKVRNLAVYNGELYASLGISAGDGEVWKYDGIQWTKVGGDGVNNGWTNIIENVPAMATYMGKLYAANGDTINSDAAIWAYGGNGILRSVSSSWTADTWYHVAATYDGSTMKLYVNGVLDSSTQQADITLPNNTVDLLLGTTYGSRDNDTQQGYFLGNIDEVRISNTTRSSFTYLPYTTQKQTVTTNLAAWGLGVGGVGSFDGFLADDTSPGSVKYRLSTDNGTSWEYWNSGTNSWATSVSLAETNTKAEIDTHIPSLDITNYGVKWQAVLEGNGNQQVRLNKVTIEALPDNANPTPPSNITVLSSAGGSQINPESFPDADSANSTWFSYSSPVFQMVGAGDSGGAGLAGYWIYFGSDPTANPFNVGTFHSSSASTYDFTPTNLISGTTYYLRVQTQDKAQRLSTVYAPLIYRFDNNAPQNPSIVSVSPSGLSATNIFTFFWPNNGVGAATDCSVGSCAGLAGFQYKTGSTNPADPYSIWSNTITDTTIVLDNAAYKENANMFYLRTVDAAGNVNANPISTYYYYAGSAPTPPRNLTVTPTSSNTNSFAFSWDVPETFAGDPSKITYCYTINTLPSEATCTFTSPGATSLAADAFANQPDDNVFYLVAKDEVGNINYTSKAEATFTAKTTAPGIPVNLEIADVSVKATSSWKLAISWEPPTGASGDLTYKIYSSTDDSTYVFEASTTGIAFVSTGLEQETYYYKVRACDDTNNCGPLSQSVSLMPTGRFTSPPTLTADPEVSNITTKKGTISWSTDRTADTRIQYGTSSGDYFDEEPSNSTMTTEHEINLTNLSPGKKYFAVARWTDEDGNTGVSDEINFQTSPAPTVQDPKIKVTGIDNVTISYTVKDADKVKIYYGKTSSFGGTVTLATSRKESTYETTLANLEDGTKYYYKIDTFDSEGAEYEGNILSFETLPRPKIDTVRIQQIKGSAQPSVLISWETNTEVSSIVTYFPSDNSADAHDEVNVQLTKGLHRMIIRGLKPQALYSMIVKGRDKAGNEASSEALRFTTATDTRPPVISDLNIEASIVPVQGSDANSAQLIVNWNTDEAATSQVEFGEGTGGNYSQKTQEDTNLTFNHIVVISNLVPSKVYHLRVTSKDSYNNIGNSVDTVTITPKATNNALDLVITNLREAFGFLKGVK